MNKKAVLIIPYFGRMPDYFNLWLKSAESNPDYNFFIYTDLDLKVKTDSNVKIKKMSFVELKRRIKNLFGNDIKLKNPYKLCDYRPAYGMIFQDDIKDFDFWGFCDIDLIFGDLNKFIPRNVFEEYDKIFYHGHFCLMKNCEKMNKLFLKKYEKVCDFSFASHTNYSCHFDENGTIAYADKFDDAKLYFKWLFYDPPYNNFQFITNKSNTEKYALWKNGKLFMFDLDGNKNEIIYIHLQKRKMHNWSKISESCNSFYLFRNEFIDENLFELEDFSNSKYATKKRDFEIDWRKKRLKQIYGNLLSGSLIYRSKKFIAH